MNINHTDTAVALDQSGFVGGSAWNKAHTVTWGPGGSTSNSVVLGRNAGQAMNTDTLATFVGAGAGQANTTGLNNTFLGYAAGLTNTIGADNTFVGVDAGAVNSDGFGNTIVGSNAGIAIFSGTGNTIIGNAAGQACVNASFNTYVGKFCSQQETGQANADYGYKAAFVSTSGDRNTRIGNSAAFTATTGDDNTIVGYNAGNGLTTGSGNTIIGANLTGIAAALTNSILIGDGAGNIRLRADGSGNAAIGTLAPTSLGSGGTYFQTYNAAASGGLLAASSLVANGSDVGYVDFGTFGTAGGEKRAAALHAFLTADSTAAITGKLNLYTTTAGAIAESVHFDSAGITPGTSRALICTTKAGTPVDGDFTTPTNGGIVVDSAANKIWVRIGGTWKGVVVA